MNLQEFADMFGVYLTVDKDRDIAEWYTDVPCKCRKIWCIKDGIFGNVPPSVDMTGHDWKTLIVPAGRKDE